jgi:hypothetical protein
MAQQWALAYLAVPLQKPNNLGDTRRAAKVLRKLTPKAHSAAICARLLGRRWLTLMFGRDEIFLVPSLRH